MFWVGPYVVIIERKLFFSRPNNRFLYKMHAARFCLLSEL